MFFITGCATPMTYEEMEDAHEIAETKEEKDALNKKIVAFEVNWEKAILYFEDKRACKALTEYNWYCDNVRSIEERKIRSVDGLVRAYKREHQSCWCVHTDRMKQTLGVSGY